MKPKSSSALYLLFAEGFCFLLISAAVIACGFVLNYQDDFDYDQVDEEHDYTQYWVGFVLLITAFLAMAAGTRQRSRWLVLTAMFLFFVCILVSLFALVVEGNDWIKHKNAVRRQSFWESKVYQCTSPNSTSCLCRKAGTTQVISRRLDCKSLERVNYLYGGLVCCILAGIFLALSSIIIVMIFIPIQPFTVPVPTKRIKKITVMEEKPEPIVVYKPKKVVEPKVKEVVVRERRPPPQRVIVEPPHEPKTEVEEIVIRERPRVRTIVYDEPRQQKPEVAYRLPRTRTLVYDEPRTQPARIVQIEPAPEPKKEKVYDVGRFVPKVHPTPHEPGLEEGFIVNPNFRKEETLPEPEEPEAHPVHYATQEVDPPVRYIQREPAPVRYIQREPAPVRYIRREKPQQVRHVREPRIVYEQQRAIVPVHKGQVMIHSKRPKPSYIIRREGQRPLIAVRRRRAYSDEGPDLYRPREVREPEPRRRAYVSQAPPKRPPQRTFVSGPQAPRVVRQRVRSNSDEGPRLYQERPTGAGRIYTDKEIAMAREEPATSGGAKPRVFNEVNIDTANLGHDRPNTAHIQGARNEGYDRVLEANLPSADQWKQRPGTPY